MQTKLIHALCEISTLQRAWKFANFLLIVNGSKSDDYEFQRHKTLLGGVFRTYHLRKNLLVGYRAD